MLCVLVGKKVSCIVIFFFCGGKARTSASIAQMSTENQSACFMIIILAAVFLMFYNSSGTRYRGTQCSARKSHESDDEEDEDHVISARAADMDEASEDEPQDPTDPFGFVPLSKEGEEQFSNMTVKGKTPTDIRKLEANLRADMGVESSMARWIGVQKTGTLASCTGGTKEPSTKPTQDTMFMLPAAFS